MIVSVDLIAVQTLDFHILLVITIQHMTIPGTRLQHQVFIVPQGI